MMITKKYFKNNFESPNFKVIANNDDNREHIRVIWDNQSNFPGIPRLKIIWDNNDPKRVKILVNGEERKLKN